MTERVAGLKQGDSAIPNGSAAAAILSAGVGIFVFAVVALVGDKSPSVKSALIFYRPTGALSGVATLGIAAWVVSWLLLEWRWGGRSVSAKSVCAAAVALLVLGLLLTFPPIVDLI